MKKGIASIPPPPKNPKPSPIPPSSNSIPLNSKQSLPPSRNSHMATPMATPMDVDESLEKTPEKKEDAKKKIKTFGIYDFTLSKSLFITKIIIGNLYYLNINQTYQKISVGISDNP